MEGNISDNGQHSDHQKDHLATINHGINAGNRMTMDNTPKQSVHNNSDYVHVDSSLVLKGTGPTEDRNDNEDVVIGKIRNGCDINFKLDRVDEPLRESFNSINIGSTSKLNKNWDTHIFSIEKQQKQSLTSDCSSTVISNTGHCNSKTLTERGPQDVATVGGTDCFNTKRDNVLVHTEPSSNESAYKLECNAKNLPATLYGCYTPNCPRNHTINMFESQPLGNELSSALSCKSSYCTNYSIGSMSRSQRKPSFFKSQSLDIGQGPLSISYVEHDDHIFSQLSEINENKQQRMLDYIEQGGTECDGNIREDEARGETEDTAKALKTQPLECRPIYPDIPYSPYTSPYSSPRSNRRRPPLRESRRISIEQSGSFLQLNQYKLMDQIGQGSYGLVKLAYSEEDSTHYAMKILSKRRLLRQAGLMKRGPKKFTSPLERVYREIAVLKKLDHPNIVKLVEVLDDPLDDSLYMVFELLKQGEVLSIPTKTPLSAERVWSIFRDTLLGLEYLHYQRIIHGDIKPGNLLLTECGRVKIADLGVCNEFLGEDSTMTNNTTAGTPAFRAPESLNMGQNMYCGKAADIWALGITLYALIFGNVPFVATSIPVLYEKIKNKPLSFPENIKICPELKDCIERMLVKNPQSRITLPQLKVHSWVSVAGLHLLPSEEENCRLVQVDDNDINSVVRSIPKLDTLILIKTMLKKHSFGNPFTRGGISGRASHRGISRLERFVRAGRSNSAPGSYNNIADRQISADNILPSLSEHTSSNCTNEEYQ